LRSSAQQITGTSIKTLRSLVAFWLRYFAVAQIFLHAGQATAAFSFGSDNPSICPKMLQLRKKTIL
jgi:hypothetical protein